MGKFKRQTPEYWKTREIADYVGISVAGVLMHVSRGNLTPIERRGREAHLFTDEEVQRFFRSRVSGQKTGDSKKAANSESRS